MGGELAEAEGNGMALTRTPFKRKPGKRLRAKVDSKLAAWSKAIKERDVYCQWPHCWRIGPSIAIDAHHKAMRSQRPDLKYELSNGIVLCRFHHTFTHSEEGRDEAVSLGILNLESYELAMKA